MRNLKIDLKDLQRENFQYFINEEEDHVDTDLRFNLHLLQLAGKIIYIIQKEKKKLIIKERNQIRRETQKLQKQKSLPSYSEHLVEKFYPPQISSPKDLLERRIYQSTENLNKLKKKIQNSYIEELKQEIKCQKSFHEEKSKNLTLSLRRQKTEQLKFSPRDESISKKKQIEMQILVTNLQQKEQLSQIDEKKEAYLKQKQKELIDDIIQREQQYLKKQKNIEQNRKKLEQQEEHRIKKTLLRLNRKMKFSESRASLHMDDHNKKSEIYQQQLGNIKSKFTAQISFYTQQILQNVIEKEKKKQYHDSERQKSNFQSTKEILKEYNSKMSKIKGKLQQMEQLRCYKIDDMQQKQVSHEQRFSELQQKLEKERLEKIQQVNQRQKTIKLKINQSQDMFNKKCETLIEREKYNRDSFFKLTQKQDNFISAVLPQEILKLNRYKHDIQDEISKFNNKRKLNNLSNSVDI